MQLAGDMVIARTEAAAAAVGNHNDADGMRRHFQRASLTQVKLPGTRIMKVTDSCQLGVESPFMTPGYLTRTFLMTRYDIFNGDADGLCALQQLRFAEPAKSVLITGIKSDIALLARAPAGAGDQVTVLDVSIDANMQPLLAMLARGASVFYVDHHGAARIPAHPLLHALIDRSPEVCTGIIVDRYLGGRYRIWAVVAAFGDGLDNKARALANSLLLDAQQTAALRDLGTCLNYNAYGGALAELNVDPALLYASLHEYTDPFEFMRRDALFERMRTARDRDLDCARRLATRLYARAGEVVLLPDDVWSRRVRGLYANVLAQAAPRRAHALLVQNANDTYSVSVRAPLEGGHALRGADRLCRQFEGGGGRPAAASIPSLPKTLLQAFIQAFEAAFGA